MPGIETQRRHSGKEMTRPKRDHYQRLASREGTRARSYYKLKAINERFGVLTRRCRVLDLGAYPGGWSLYCAHQGCEVTALDLRPLEPIPGATMVVVDVLDPEALEGVLRDSTFDVTLSDLSGDLSGIPVRDQMASLRLARRAMEIACRHLRPMGALVFKVFQSPEAMGLLPELQKVFRVVKAHKPSASRPASSEFYYICLGKLNT